MLALKLIYGAQIIAVIVLASAGCTNRQPPSSPSVPAGTISRVEFGDLPPVSQAASFSHTDVVPHLEGRITPGRNYLFCATFKLVWGTYGNSGAVQDKATAQAIDRFAFSKADLDPGCCLTMVGSREDILSKMQDRFPSAQIEFPDSVQTTDNTAFAYLQKSLPFRERFDRLDAPITFKSKLGSRAVAGFGIEQFEESNQRDTLLRSQITIVDYKNRGDFVIRLNTTSARDRMYLAKVASADTLQETLRQVQARVDKSYPEDSEESKLQDGESLAVPVVSVGVLRQFSELIPANLTADQKSGWATCQVIRFRLDEAGAKLESYAYYDSLGGGAAPRRFVFDGPFLLYLVQEQGVNPYFVAWIANEEVLELASKPE